MNVTYIAAVAALSLATTPAFAAGGTAAAQEREQVRAQVHHQLTTQGEVSEQEAGDLDGEVSENAAHAGYGPAIKAAIQADLAAGCKGTCLAADIHAINGAVAKGVPPADAARATTGAKAHAAGAPSDPQARSEDHRRDAEHRAAVADRVHDRTADRGQAGSHAMGAGHH